MLIHLHGIARRWSVSLTVVTALLLCCTVASAEDTVELLSGATVRGEITERTPTGITVKSTVAGQILTRKFPLNRIHAVTTGDKREVLNAKSDTPSTPATPGKSTSPATKPVDPSNRKTRQQVLAEIDRAGKTPPDWFAATALNYPPTLDLSWTVPPPKGWNNQSNVGQYMWDIINPNPSRWPSGIKLLHHMLGVNQGNAATIERIQLQMARIYFSHLNDYARAAFWFRTAGAENTEEFGESSVSLAECYFHLGNKDMAAELLSRVTDRNSVVKAWTTLGEVDKALAIVQKLLADDNDGQSHMYAGDACRIGARYDEAIGYYQKVVDLGDPGKDGRKRRNQGRAQASMDAIRLFEKSDVARVPDGVYNAQSLGYEGQVSVEVTVAGGRIANVRVVRHNEKQFYSAISDTPQRIISKQSVKGVDTTSNATITSEAIINATAKALASGSK